MTKSPFYLHVHIVISAISNSLYNTEPTEDINTLLCLIIDWQLQPVKDLHVFLSFLTVYHSVRSLIYCSKYFVNHHPCI